MFLLKRLEFVFLGDLGICLKRKRDIRIKTIIPSQNTALLLTPALIINKKQKLARLITQYRDILSNTSQGTAFLLQGVAEDDSSLLYVYFDKLPCWRHPFPTLILVCRFRLFCQRFGLFCISWFVRQKYLTFILSKSIT